MAISNISNSYQQLSSGKRINSAADDSAGLAISKKLESQSKGLEVGANNASAGQDLLKVADGGLSSIQDSLQRMRELGVRASNTAIYSGSDLKAMQDEIDQLKQSIQDAAKGTQFNTINLLDGSKADLNLATNPNGSGMKIQLVNSTLEELGIADFNIMGKFDLSVLDKAIDKVSRGRSEIGARMNALDSVVDYNQNASLNQTAAQSRIQDLDIPKAISDLKKEQVLEDYRMSLAKEQMEQEGHITKLLAF